jgi:IclR family acetate operon transcriptional repressor
MKHATRDRYVTRSVERALSILQLFALGEAEIGLSEISGRVALHQSTVFRLLATLSAAGFTEQSPLTGRYRLGLSALTLGQAFLRHSDLRQIAEPALALLRDHSGETVHLATLDGTQVVYLEKLPGLHPIGLMSSRVGDRAPAHCTGLGKALLAHQPEAALREAYRSGLTGYTPQTITRIGTLLTEMENIRQTGFAIDDEEHEPGVVCIAASVSDSQRVVAAISVSGPSERIREKIRTSRLLDQVRQAANDISVHLGHAAIPNPAVPMTPSLAPPRRKTTARKGK